MHYRGKPVAHRLDRTLFETVTAQLKTRAITVKTRTRTDATVIASASEWQDDGQGMQHKGKPAHVGVDAASYLVEKLADLDQPQ